jgi:hypothetical protein
MGATGPKRPNHDQVSNIPKKWCQRVVLPILACLIVLLVLAHRVPLSPMIGSFEVWIKRLGIWGPLVYGLIYVAAVVALAPASALTLAAGALFGLVVGTVTASLASTTGAALAFLIARYLARDAVARKLGGDPRFEAVDRAIARNGWIIVALLRLSPVIPFNLQNYVYGLTGISQVPLPRIRFGVMLCPGWLTRHSRAHGGEENEYDRPHGGVAHDPDVRLGMHWRHAPFGSAITRPGALAQCSHIGAQPDKAGNP